MLVVAGPPGSGKSTSFPIRAFGADAFNVDDRCAQLVGSYRAITPAVRAAVARECESFVATHVAARRSVAVETTMRTRVSIDQALLARATGFLTVLRFVCTESPEENVRRVLQRAQSGGHAASETEIRRVYTASLANLPAALDAFEQAFVYDSSQPWVPVKLVATARSGRVNITSSAPRWVRDALDG